MGFGLKLILLCFKVKVDHKSGSNTEMTPLCLQSDPPCGFKRRQSWSVCKEGVSCSISVSKCPCTPPWTHLLQVTWAHNCSAGVELNKLSSEDCKSAHLYDSTNKTITAEREGTMSHWTVRKLVMTSCLITTSLNARCDTKQRFWRMVSFFCLFQNQKHRNECLLF